MGFLSRLRYWMALERWAGWIFSWFSRSAIVRATFRILVWALALNPNLSMANSNNPSLTFHIILITVNQHKAVQHALINLLHSLQSFWLHQDEKRLWLFWT